MYYHGFHHTMLTIEQLLKASRSCKKWTIMNVIEEPDHFPTSPRWERNSKLFVGFWLIIFIIGILLYYGNLFRYVLMAFVISFVLRPIVDWLETKNISRLTTTITLFVLIIGGLIAIPITTLPSIFDRVVNFINSIPVLLEQLSNMIVEFLRDPTIQFGEFSYTLPIDGLQINEFEQLLANTISLIASWIGSSSDIVTNVASGTVSFISSFAFMLFIAFYLTKDGHQIAASIVNILPASHRDDISWLIRRISMVWDAFLRGQLILMVAIGLLVFIIASILGLPNPVGLAVMAGLMEIIPYVGPILAAVPGLLLAFFQSDASWLGTLMGPFWFTIVVAVGYWLTQTAENYYLVPRIMGNRLRLHRAIVFAGALAGLQIAGIFGILVAAPVVATLREILRYLYCKLSDQTLADLRGEEHQPTIEPIIE